MEIKISYSKIKSINWTGSCMIGLLDLHDYINLYSLQCQYQIVWLIYIVVKIN